MVLTDEDKVAIWSRHTPVQTFADFESVVEQVQAAVIAKLAAVDVGPVGKVESASLGSGGFHACLSRTHAMPKQDALLFSAEAQAAAYIKGALAMRERVAVVAEADELHNAMRELGYTTHGQTSEYQELFALAIRTQEPT